MAGSDGAGLASSSAVDLVGGQFSAAALALALLKYVVQGGPSSTVLLLPTMLVVGCGVTGSGAGSDGCAARGVPGGVGLLPVGGVPSGVGLLAAGACSGEEGNGRSS